MMIHRRRLVSLPRLVVALVLVAILLGGGYVFTASNTVGSAPAGEGESASLSGYTATAISWTLDSANPANIQQVSFTLSTVTASTKVYAGADNGTTITWSNVCSQGAISGGSATETCTFGTEPTAAGTTKLAVSAAN
jgi:hypothetical protein